MCVPCPLPHLPSLCRYQGYIGAYLVVGGVDSTGPNLYTVHAHGSTDKLPYVSMGEKITEKIHSYVELIWSSDQVVSLGQPFC